MTRDLVDVLSAALVPITAVVALVVGYRQYAIAKQAARLQLYERRVNVFRAYRDVLNRMVFDNNLHETPYHELMRDLWEAEFLFLPPEAEAIRVAGERVRQLATLCEARISSTLPRIPQVMGPEDFVRVDGELRNWAWNELESANTRFAKYLAVKI